jgi:Ca-activated chloride channel family protein
MLKPNVILILTLFATATLRAQAVVSHEEQDFTLYAASRLVVLNVSVQDAHGSNVRGLTAQQFKIYEEGREQIIKQFAGEDRPVTVGLIVDASGSMRTKQAEVATAALSFVRASNPEDQVFVVTFNDRAYSGLPPDVPFSGDPIKLRDALLGRASEGKTALYDALALAAEHLAKGKWENKALLLISDGGDNSSSTTFNEALRRVQLSGATVYTIGLYDPDEGEHNLGVLNRLAKLTGGEAFEPMELPEIRSLCLRIAEDIRASYTIAYTPPKPEQHIATRKIKVFATAPTGVKLTARTRANYILAEQ